MHSVKSGECRNRRRRRKEPDKQSSSKVPRLDETIPVAGAESRTPAARRQALSRAKSALPHSPRKYVETVGDLMSAATPRKRAIFETQGQSSSVPLKIGRDVISALQQSQRSRDKASRQTRSALLSVCAKYHSVRQSSKLYHIHRKTAAKRLFKDVSSCSASERVEPQVKRRKCEMEISNFLESVSHPLPDKKHVSKKTGKHSAVLTKPLKDLHDDFVESGAGDVSFAQFAKCRPAYIHRRPTYGHVCASIAQTWSLS